MNEKNLEKVNHEVDTSKIARNIFLKATLLSLFIALIFLLLTALGVLWYAWEKFGVFADTAKTSRQAFLQTVDQGWNTSVVETDDHKNILILGEDTLPTRGDIPPLTDTLLLVSFNLDSGQISMLSFPRDLWLDEYQTRINALYFYGQEKYPNNPKQFPTEVLSELTQIPIHHTIVISLDDLEKLIDLSGGVTIQIEEAFTDTEFPRTDVDITKVNDPKLLYETISFEKGTETMSGERALKYIRSRHSSGDQGTDTARGTRQQQIVQALLTQFSDPSFWIKNPKAAGEMYAFYHETFEVAMPFTQILATLKRVLPHKESLTLQKNTLSIQPDDPEGVLIHPPPSKYQNQWVYAIVDLEKFRQEITKNLGY